MGFFDSATLDSAMAAQFQGQRLLDDAEAQRADTAFRKQQTERSKIETENMARAQKDREAMLQFMQAQEEQDALPTAVASDKAQFYSKASQFAASRGDFEASKQMSDLAKGEVDLAAKAQKTQAEAKTLAQEELASAALDAETSPSPEVHARVFKAAVKAGIPPQDIPMPGTPQFATFVKQSQTAASTSKDRLAMTEKVREFDQRQEQQKAEAQQRAEDRRLQRQQIASNQSFQHQMARENLEVRKQLADSTIAAREAKATAVKPISATMERQATAVVNAANEAGQALVRMSGMTSGSTVSAFNHLEDPKTVLKALTTTGTNKLNPENVQMMQANLQMLGLEVAQAMAAPFKPNKEQISEARRAVEPIPGDTEYSAMYKIALAADVLRTRLEATPRTDALAGARTHAEETLGKFPTATQIYEHAKARKIKLGTMKDAPTFMDRMLKAGPPAGISAHGQPDPAAAGATPRGAPPADIQNLLDMYPAAKK